MSPLSALLTSLFAAIHVWPEPRDTPGVLAVAFSLLLVVWLLAAEELDLRRGRRPAD